MADRGDDEANRRAGSPSTTEDQIEALIVEPAPARRKDLVERLVAAGVRPTFVDDPRVTPPSPTETRHEALERRMHNVQRLEALGALAGGIAHDFNNILQVVSGFTKMVLDDLDADSPAREHLDAVLQAGRRGQKLVQRILTLSKKPTPDEGYELVALEPLLHQVVGMARDMVPSSIQIRTAVDTDTRVRGRLVELQQVFMNMVTNAFQAIGHNAGAITIATRMADPPDELMTAAAQQRASRYVRIDVADTGHGIPADIENSIFQPFFTTRDIGEGTGLGLSVSHSIVRAHQGLIAFDSAVGQGTTFQVYLPAIRLTPSSKPMAVRPTADTAAQPGMPGRVLVVDDEPMVAMYVEQALKRRGFEVVKRADVQAAWLAWEQSGGAFDVVITDYAMPGGTGLDLAHKLRAVRPDLPIILLTGYANAHTEEGAAGLNVRVLSKPVTTRKLIEVVTEAVSGDVDTEMDGA